MSQSFLAILGLLAVGQSSAIEPDLDIALGTVGLNTRTARFDDSLLSLFRQGEFATPLYGIAHENPWRMPFFADTLRRDLSLAQSKPQDAIGVLTRLVGGQVRRSLVGNPIQPFIEPSKESGALARTLADWKKNGWLTGEIPNISGIPAETQSAAALVLSVVPNSLEFRRLALMDMGDLGTLFSKLTGPVPADSNYAEAEARRRLYSRVDLPYLSAGAFDLALAVREAQIRVDTVDDKLKYDAKIETRWGDIILSGGSDSRHSGRALLVIDTGGTDTYVNLPSTQSAANWCSISIDSNGDDKYVSDPVLTGMEVAKWPQRSQGGGMPGPAGALFGYALLSDSEGKDIYRSHRPGIASARYGVAAILDAGGDDVYDGYADSIAFATAGLGMIDDVEGNDIYKGFNQVQGCGQTLGVGALIDRAGNDEYIANDEVIDFPSPQSAQHNVSMAQGAGNGRRADYLDGHSLAGGVGVLYDISGDDKYTSAVFGQGVGYWMGVGLLLDSAGTDQYSGMWYVQGASAHFAFGYLEDEQGNDTYNAPMNMAIGAGHDFGTGVLIDRLGNDVYTGPNLSLGAGNANGIGWFVDMAGNDKYSSTGLTLGSASEATKGSMRMRAICFGVFMDMAGDDVYPPSITWAKNASRTAQVKDRGPTAAESQLGVFWDR